MHGVALGQLSPEDGSCFDLVVVERIDSEDEEGGVRKIVVVIERAEIVTLVILPDSFGVLCLFSSIYTPTVDRLDQ